jgi:ribonuclease E
VVRDLFNEDFKDLVIQGGDAYDMVEPYLQHVSPDLVSRLRRYTGTGDVFQEMRVDEQLMKALDRKVFLPSGGSLVIDRTEAMTVIDVNTGKYTGAGGNLEETVTRNNLEAAEEIVRQLRLRDIGGIIVIDFIDMVLEANRDLVLRRLTECLGRDRTKHQVAEVTSLGLVQMTRKRIGTGLLEAFSEPCEHCQGRGLIVHHEPIDPKKKGDEDSGGASRRSRRSRRGRGDDEGSDSGKQAEEAASAKHGPTPAEFAAMAGKAAAEKAAEEEKASREEGSEEAAAKVAADTRDEQPETQPESTPEPTPESEREPEREPEPEPVPATPTVVTSTRRRVARRPAGPPAGAAAATIVADPPETTEASVDGDGSTLAGESEQSVAAHVPVKKRGSRKR